MTNTAILQNLYDLSLEELQAWIQEQGEPAYRARQIFEWLPRGLRDADDLSNLPKRLRGKLSECFRVSPLELEAVVHSQVDATSRYAFLLAGGHRVETVFMQYQTGNSVCLSTQSGCKMGCTFCASTGVGFGRNLTAGELYAQVARVAREKGQKISHVVLMGIGEPLENYEEVLKFIRRVPELGISLRHITLSTCGLVPQIQRLQEEHLPLTLALSLHASNDELRKRLMPIARFYPLKDVLASVFDYARATGRRPTFEYALFKDVNDHPEQARELAMKLKGHLAHVNLIPANEFPGSPYRRSSSRATQQFQKILKEAGIACTIRRELGGDIAAACGQLRRTREEVEPCICN